MRDEVVLPGDAVVTLDEKWKAEGSGHWYMAASDFAVEVLGAGSGRSCLVVGSPLFEARRLKKSGWEVTYLDVRVPPFAPGRLVRGDVRDRLFGEGEFSAVSSTCVLCHVGMGRYGDRVDVEHGDCRMLEEVCRVLCVGGVAALMFGPVVEADRPVRTTEHRVYTMGEVMRLVAASGLRLVDARIWDVGNARWRAGDIPGGSVEHPDYVSVKVEKAHVASADPQPA